jgi:hypothetical protein
VRLELCREILKDGGTLPQGTDELYLSREDLKTVWRVLRYGGTIALAELFTNPVLESVSPEAACLAIRVFSELGLLEYRLGGDLTEISINGDAGKVRLESSPLFCRLSENQPAE